MNSISFIIPVYNVERYLVKCVESILEQRIDGVEIILIDDGSTDNSGIICDELARKNKNIAVVHQKNSGVSATRNIGIDKSNSKYIMFVDSDDYLEGNSLSEICKYLENNNYEMIFFGYNKVDEEGNIISINESVFKKKIYDKLNFVKDIIDANEILPTTPWQYLIKASVIKNNKIKYDEQLNYSEDFDFNVKCLESVKSIKSVDKIIYNYRLRENSATTFLTYKNILDNINVKRKYYRKYNNSRLADMYTGIVCNLFMLKNKDERKIIANIIKEDKDILSNTKLFYHNLACLLFKIFGFYYGSKIFYFLKQSKKQIEQKCKSKL